MKAYFDKLVPVILASVLLVVYILIFTKLHEAFACKQIAGCHIWGNWIGKTFYFFIAGLFFFLPLLMVFGERSWSKKKDRKFWKVLLCIGIVLLIIGTYAGFSSVTKTSDTFIYSRDIINETLNAKPKVGEVLFTEISNIRLDTTKSKGTKSWGPFRCGYTLYLFTKDGKIHSLDNDISGNRDFVSFLVIEKKIKPLPSKINECGTPDVYSKYSIN